MNHRLSHTCNTTVVTKSRQSSASFFEVQGGVAIPTADTISGLKPSSFSDLFLSIIASNAAAAPPSECPTNRNPKPCNHVGDSTTTDDKIPKA